MLNRHHGTILGLALTLFPTVTLAQAPAGAPQPSAGAPATFDAAAVAKQSRETYEKLSTYRFEQRVEIEEAPVAPKPAKQQQPAAEAKATKLPPLTFVLAADGAEAYPKESDGPEVFQLPTDAERYRWELRDERGTKLLVTADGKSVYYDSEKNEYSRGGGFTDHFAAAPSAMFLGILQSGFLPLTEGAVQNLKAAGEAEFALGKQTRKCYVITGTIPAPPPLDLESDKPPSDDQVRAGLLHLKWTASMLGMHGLLGRDNPAQYSTHAYGDTAEPMPGRVNPDRSTPERSTTVTLWIDQESHLILRSRLSARLWKHAFDPNSPDAFAPKPGTEAEQEVDFTAGFTFTAADTGAAVPKELFQFTPPKDSREVPNIRTVAPQKKSS